MKNKTQGRRDPKTSQKSATILQKSAATTPTSSGTTGRAQAGDAKAAQLRTGGQQLEHGRGSRSVVTIAGQERAASWTPQQHLHGLSRDPRAALENQTPAELFEHGLPICQAIKADKVGTKVLLLAELTRLWRAVKVGDAKTWGDQESLQDAVDDIVELHSTMKVEEALACFKQIRQGRVKLYGRLDTPTLLEALRDYEDRHTTTYREAMHSRPAKVETAAWEHRPAGPGTISVEEALKRLKASLPSRRKTLEELGGHIHLTPEDIQQIEHHATQTKKENTDPAQATAGPGPQPPHPTQVSG